MKENHVRWIFVGDCCLRGRNGGESARVRWVPDSNTNKRYFVDDATAVAAKRRNPRADCRQAVCLVVRSQNLIFLFSLPDPLGGRHTVQSCT